MLALAYSSIVLFDLGAEFVSLARGTAGKRFVVRVFALTDGNEISVADSRPITLFSARKHEVRARKSDCLDVEIYSADEVPPTPEGYKVITRLVGFQIIARDREDLFDRRYLTRSPSTPVADGDVSHVDVSTVGGSK